MHDHLLRGPILNPRDDGTVEFIADGALLGDENGRIALAGTWDQIRARISKHVSMRRSDGIICPPFLDAHIHIPQHPIRGHFLDGVEQNPQAGRLIAGLNRNVFPAEARCADPAHAEQTIRQFLEDTLAHGVVGGAAYMTVHHPATVRALEILPETWSVGLVLMNQNCPESLRTDEQNLEQDLTELAERFGRRCILTDRFAVAVSSELRRRAVEIASRFGWIAQTHLNEQLQEKQLVEHRLYPDAASYTHVYERDGLLDSFAILAHCIHMSDDELEIVRRQRCAVAHCPTSNTLLESGVMPLERIRDRGIEYAICTDVGASPTTSLLAEMAQFLKVHTGRSSRARPSEALYRTTLAPAKMLGLGSRIGSFDIGKELSFVEIESSADMLLMHVDAVIRRCLLDDSDDSAGDITATAARLDRKVLRVTLAGEIVWERTPTSSS